MTSLMRGKHEWVKEGTCQGHSTEAIVQTDPWSAVKFQADPMYCCSLNAKGQGSNPARLL